jgi:Transglycosylase SLT domain
MIPTTGSDFALRGAHGRVGAAISQASARTGVDFTYLFNQARIESSLNPNARARTSSATGLYQFIEQTWLGTVRRHGAEHGLGWAANAIQRGQNGRFHVADPQMRRAILDLRRNPEASAAMAAEFASDNGQYLERRLGRPAESVDLYLAHFLGAGGAARFLRAHDANPGGAAAPVLPAAARANRWVFYNRNGSPRSFAEIRERFAARIGGGGPNPVTPRQQVLPPVQLATLETGFMPGVVKGQPMQAANAELARLAYLMLAGIGDE